MKIYRNAKEKGTWHQYFVVSSTNCTDKINGHQFILSTKEQEQEIKQQRSRYNSGIQVWICRKCGKIKQSM